MPEVDLSAIWLTLKLATLTTAILLVIGTPLAWNLSHTRGWWRGPVNAVVALPFVLPPTVLGFYLLIMMGTERTDRTISRMAGVAFLAIQFFRASSRLGHLLSAFRRPASAKFIRGYRKTAAGSGSDITCLTTGYVFQRDTSHGKIGISHGNCHGIRPYCRGIRRRIDDRRQYSGKNPRIVRLDIRSRRSA